MAAKTWSSAPTATIALNTAYVFKVSVQSSQFDGTPSTYRFKFWPEGQPEPAEWYMSAVGNGGEPESGSLLLVAHQAMVSFGNVTVTPHARRARSPSPSRTPTTATSSSPPTNRPTTMARR